MSFSVLVGEGGSDIPICALSISICYYTRVALARFLEPKVIVDLGLLFNSRSAALPFLIVYFRVNVFFRGYKFVVGYFTNLGAFEDGEYIDYLPERVELVGRYVILLGDK